MVSDALQRAVLALMIGDYVAGLTTPVVRLFTDNVPITPDTDLSALAEPTGSWYAEQAVTYGEAFENDDGGISISCTSVQFNYTGTDPAETVYGWYVVDTAGPTYLHGGNFDGGRQMANELDGCIVQPGFTIPPVSQG